jgi:cation:H+ antiporter
MTFYIVVFVISCLLMIMSGRWLVRSLSTISEFLGMKKFTVAFLLMSFATATPELFIGISSALRGISELSLGNILGQNIIHFTVAVFICVLIRGSFSVRSKTTRITAFFSGFMAIFPLILILDGALSRVDGFILICLFIVYTVWMIKKGKKYDELYEETNNQDSVPILKKVGLFFKNISTFAIGAGILIIASQGIVKSAIYFADSFDLPLVIIGVLIVSLGTALPEVYFSAFSAKESGELMAGNLLGSTVVSTSLVLGIVSMISPINNIEIFSYFASRFTLFVAVILFTYFMLTGRKISRREGWILLSIYVIFITLEIFI